MQFWCGECGDWLWEDGVIHTPGNHSEEQEYPKRWRDGPPAVGAGDAQEIESLETARLLGEPFRWEPMNDVLGTTCYTGKKNRK